MRRLLCLLFVVTALVAVVPVSADEQIHYVSQPDMMTVFLNNIAAVQDQLTVPGGAAVQIVLPAGIYQDTLVVREDGSALPMYRISHASGQAVLELPASGDESTLRTLTLDYLTSGISWKPVYTMGFSENDATVDFTFYAEIQNTAFTLDGIRLLLATGRVDVSQMLQDVSTVTMNQYVAGYEAASGEAQSLIVGAVTIQHVYNVNEVTSEPGDALYVQLLEDTLPARRVLLWNANTDRQVTVIYKVRNESEIPFTEGTTRSYQDGMFVGSDFIEYTPIGSEGSVTVGHLQDVRVNRAETTAYDDLLTTNADTVHEVELELTNFSSEAITLEVVDIYPNGAVMFEFSEDPEREAGNLLRWEVTIPAGETVTITYEYRATY